MTTDKNVDVYELYMDEFISSLLKGHPTNINGWVFAYGGKSGTVSFINETHQLELMVSPFWDGMYYQLPIDLVDFSDDKWDYLPNVLPKTMPLAATLDFPNDEKVYYMIVTNLIVKVEEYILTIKK